MQNHELIYLHTKLPSTATAAVYQNYKIYARQLFESERKFN